MSTQPFLSQVALFAFSYAPRGWALCAGQLLPINQNQALFSLLGTTYGGDGRTNFALPDLRGRVALGVGQGAGLSDYQLGGSAGVESLALGPPALSAHAHTLNTSAMTATARCRNGVANQAGPSGNTPAIEAAGVTATYSNAAPDANMHASAIALGGALTAANAGGGQAHNNMQPCLVLSYCICLSGIFPSQN